MKKKREKPVLSGSGQEKKKDDMIDHIVSREFIYCGVGCKHTIFNLLPGHNKYICREKCNLSLSDNEISYSGVPYPSLDSIPAVCIFPSNISTTQLQEDTVWYWASEWCEVNNSIPAPPAPWVIRPPWPSPTFHSHQSGQERLRSAEIGLKVSTHPGHITLHTYLNAKIFMYPVRFLEFWPPTGPILTLWYTQCMFRNWAFNWAVRRTPVILWCHHKAVIALGAHVPLIQPRRLWFLPLICFPFPFISVAHRPVARYERERGLRET